MISCTKNLYEAIAKNLKDKGELIELFSHAKIFIFDSNPYRWTGAKLIAVGELPRCTIFKDEVHYKKEVKITSLKTGLCKYVVISTENGEMLLDADSLFGTFLQSYAGGFIIVTQLYLTLWSLIDDDYILHRLDVKEAINKQKQDKKKENKMIKDCSTCTNVCSWDSENCNYQDSSRPSWDDYFLDIAKQVAYRSTCLRSQVGAVIIKDKQILATGYNGAPTGEVHCVEIGCIRSKQNIEPYTRYDLCRAVHAEQNAIAQAAKHGVSIDGAVLYCTREPCEMCRRLIKNAGIKEVIVRGD